MGANHHIANLPHGLVQGIHTQRFHIEIAECGIWGEDFGF